MTIPSPYRLPDDLAYWQDTIRDELRWVVGDDPQPTHVATFCGIPLTDMTRAELIAICRAIARRYCGSFTPPAIK